MERVYYGVDVVNVVVVVVVVIVVVVVVVFKNIHCDSNGLVLRL